MPDKTPINRLGGYDWKTRSGHSASNGHGAGRGSVKQLAADILELAELQIKLLVCDLKSTLASAIGPLRIICLAAILLLGTVPVGLMAIATLLQTELGLEPIAAQLTVAGVAVLVGVLTLAAAFRALKHFADPLIRSLGELSENVSSMKEMLAGQSESEQTESKR